jgi:hypothetical protein
MRIKNSKFYDWRKDGVTQSMLMSYLKCRKYSELSLSGLTPFRTGAALQFGSMGHNILEAAYNKIKIGELLEAPGKDFVESCLVSEEEKFYKEKGGRVDANAVNQLNFNMALLKALLPHYFTYWWKKEDNSKIKWIALEEEFEFELIIRNEKIKFRGKLDGLFEAGKDLSIFETKFKSRIDEGTMSDLLAFDFQTDVYALGVEHKYGRLPCGVRYNILRRPGNKLSKTGKETLSDFTKRVSEDVEANPAHYFMRYRIDKPRKDIETFRKELTLIVTEFADWQDGKLPTFRNTRSCVDKFGTCQYLQVCAYNNRKGFYQRKQLFQELVNKKES